MSGGSLEVEILRCFIMYWLGGHLGHAILIPRTNSCPLGHLQCGYDWPRGFGARIFENNGYIHV